VSELAGELVGADLKPALMATVEAETRLALRHTAAMRILISRCLHCNALQVTWFALT
jgi:hypothetical protein